MVLCKKLGLLPTDWNSAITALQANDFTRGSMNKFIENIAKPLVDLGNATEKY